MWISKIIMPRLQCGHKYDITGWSSENAERFGTILEELIALTHWNRAGEEIVRHIQEDEV